MQLMHVRFGGGEIGDHPAVLHDVDTIAQRQHLVQAVRDEDERGARLERPHPPEQDVDVGLLEHRGRLIEEDDELPFGLLLEGQRLGQLNHLAGGEVELRGSGRRVDVDLDLLELASGGRIQLAPTDQAGPGERALGAQIDVLADGEIG